MLDNNLNNGWTLKDLPRIVWGNIKEWWNARIELDRQALKEALMMMAVAVLVWAALAGLAWLVG